MSDTARPNENLEQLRDKAIAALVPFFADGTTSDPGTIRQAVAGVVDSYDPATPKELQLVTQIIASSWASLACLRTATAAKNLSVNDVLRLQDQAIALDRSARKATKTLEVRRKELATGSRALALENIRWDEGAFQLAINQALDKLNAANARLAAYTASVTSDEPKARLPILFAEPMTPAVLARLARK